MPTTLGLHPPATKPIQGGNFWIGRRKGAQGWSTVNRTRGTIYKAFGSNGDLRPGLMASPVQSSVQCLKHKVQRRRPARTWYNPHELRELWYRGPHPICMRVYYVAIPLHDRGTRTRGPRICWTPRTKTYASGSPGSLAGLTAGSALVLQLRVALPPTWRSLAFPPTWLRTSMTMTWGSAMPMATAIASVFPVGR